MAYRNYFWRRFKDSAWVFVLMIIAIYLLNNPGAFKSLITKLGLSEADSYAESHTSGEETVYPEMIVPVSENYGVWVSKPNYMLYYDTDIMQARFTLHKLEGNYTRGNASRRGIWFNDQEAIATQTAAYRDYTGSGYDRGHLVPAGDFKCCQNSLTETFAMSNIAPFDSVLNRYAWNELEIKTRNWARRNGEIYVITGPVFEHRLSYIGRTNDVSVPTHFFKVLFTLSGNSSIPKKLVAFILPNEAMEHFVMSRSMISLDKLEEMTGLDFFKMLPDDLENKLESADKTGSW